MRWRQISTYTHIHTHGCQIHNYNISHVISTDSRNGQARQLTLKLRRSCEITLSPGKLKGLNLLFDI